MSNTVIFCSSCGVQNIGTSQFCGGCGTPVGAVAGAGQPAFEATQQIPKTAGPSVSNPKEWHEMAGLICGVLSMFLFGVFAAVPGLYFSFSARKIATQQGRGTGLSTTGIVLNGLGILATIAFVAIFLLMIVVAASSGQQDPMMQMQGAYPGYGY